MHLIDLVTSPLCRHRAFERLGNNVIGRTVAQQRPDVGLIGGEQTRTELTVGGDPHTVTGVAEGLAHGGNDPDLAPAVGVAPAGGRRRGALDRLKVEPDAEFNESYKSSIEELSAKDGLGKTYG